MGRTNARERDLFASPEVEADDILLALADHIYANTGLKPMSKALFAVSRLLLVARDGRLGSSVDAASVAAAYAEASAGLPTPLIDDYQFPDVVQQCEAALPRILRDLRRVSELTRDTDSLGLVFNALVRGRWDSGEGLGTFLTPEVVVETMVEMALTRNEAIDQGAAPGFIGDICGGTGRFPYALVYKLMQQGETRGSLEDRVFSFDQSSLATNYARLNLHFMGVRGRCEVVADSLVADAVSELKGRCAALATNPPFGAAKYEIGPALRRSLPAWLLKRLVNGGVGATADPSLLFLFRNLDLLSLGGVLGIVLPDGALQSPVLVPALREYEDAQGVALEVEALVSLPPVTFALGGTVAKTSFLIVSKRKAGGDLPMFLAEAHHIGFLKRAGKRVSDPRGSELPDIIEAYRAGPEMTEDSRWEPNWRSWSRLGLLRQASGRKSNGLVLLRNLGEAVREYVEVAPDSATDMHVSILDVDETGLIDVLASASNRPTSRVLACRPGDVLVSCINPRIWRVTVIPTLPGRWTCSPEFLVIRPKARMSPWELMLRLHHKAFKSDVQRMAGGTSSSRQRVDKDEVLAIPVPATSLPAEKVARHQRDREAYYDMRFKEGDLYSSLHAGHPRVDAPLGETALSIRES